MHMIPFPNKFICNPVLFIYKIINKDYILLEIIGGVEIMCMFAEFLN